MDAAGKKNQLGCLFEATLDGAQAFVFDDGQKLAYLEDDDEIILEGWCEKTRLGFGKCIGKVLSAK
jgi:fumarylacetoacetase